MHCVGIVCTFGAAHRSIEPLARARLAASALRDATMADWDVDDDDVEGLEEFEDLYKEDDAEEAVEVAEEAEDAGPKVDISKITSSAERNILSKRNRIWSVHAVLRPRRALPHDATDDWVERYFPEHLADFANPKLNREALGALQSCAQKKELQNFVVHGPRGAGKTAACLAFLRGFAADDGSAKSKRSRGKKAKQQRASGGAYPTLRLRSADAKTAGDLVKKLKAYNYIFASSITPSPDEATNATNATSNGTSTDTTTTTTTSTVCTPVLNLDVISPQPSPPPPGAPPTPPPPPFSPVVCGCGGARGQLTKAGLASYLQALRPPGHPVVCSPVALCSALARPGTIR